MLFSTPIKIHYQSPLKIPHSATLHSKNLTNAKLIRKILIKKDEQRPYSSTESKAKTEKTKNTNNLGKLDQYPFNLRVSLAKLDSLTENSQIDKKQKDSSLTENFKTQESFLSYRKFSSSKKMNLTIKGHFDRFLKSEQTPKNVSSNLKTECTPKKFPPSEINKKNSIHHIYHDQIHQSEKENLRKSLSSLSPINSKKLISVKTFKLEKNEIEKEKKINEFDPYDELEIIQSDLLESFKKIINIFVKIYLKGKKKAILEIDPAFKNDIVIGLKKVREKFNDLVQFEKNIQINFDENDVFLGNFKKVLYKYFIDLIL